MLCFLILGPASSRRGAPAIRGIGLRVVCSPRLPRPIGSQALHCHAFFMRLWSIEREGDALEYATLKGAAEGRLPEHRSLAETLKKR